MLKAVSARRGMPFEWSFLLDALQTERDQGITIDTTQIRLPHPLARRRADRRARPRRIPAQHDHRRLAGRRRGADHRRDRRRARPDPAPRLSAASARRRQVAVVVNKMDRVDFERGALQGDRDEISAHLAGLGVTPTADHPDFGARRRRRRRAHTPRSPGIDGPTVVDALDAFDAGAPAARTAAAAAGAGDLQVRRSPHRRRPHRDPAAFGVGDEIVIMPAGKIAQHQVDRGWPVRRARRRRAGRRRAIGRHHARPRIVRRARRRHLRVDEPGRVRTGGCARGCSGCTSEPLAVGAPITVRIGTAEADRRGRRHREGRRSRAAGFGWRRSHRPEPCRRNRHRAVAADRRPIPTPPIPIPGASCSSSTDASPAAASFSRRRPPRWTRHQAPARARSRPQRAPSRRASTPMNCERKPPRWRRCSLRCPRPSGLPTCAARSPARSSSPPASAWKTR